MPYIQITLAAGRTPEEKKALLHEVSRATAEVLDVPLKNVRAWVIDVPVPDMATAGVPLDEIRARRAAGDNSL